MRRTIEGTRAIVTGASSGIGRAIALELARQGGKVVCMARREDRLQALAKEIESLGRQCRLRGGRCYRCGRPRRGASKRPNRISADWISW